MRVEGVVKLFQRRFVVTDALAHVIFLFAVEHRCLRLSNQSKQKQKHKKNVEACDAG